jgi:alkane 1-monooxygenase
MNTRYSFRYLISLFPAALVIAGNWLGDYWTALNMVWTMLVLVAADFIFSDKKENPPNYSSSVIPDFILYLAVIFHTLSIFSLVYAAAYMNLRGLPLFLAAFSTGLHAGINGITVAHELIHRKKISERILGQWNLYLVNYMHFYVEHIKGHHKLVGTAEDAATAHYGESLYAYWLRTIVGQWKSALQIEARVLAEKQKPIYGFSNYVIRVTVFQLLTIAAVGFFLGPWSALAYVLQSFVAILLLEYVNYIEHYGLAREAGKKVEAQHSWQSDSPSSRFSLIELSRHSDHHIKASKPYHTLVSHEESPVLPHGYFGMFYFALIPPLWFKVVHPHIPANQIALKISR